MSPLYMGSCWLVKAVTRAICAFFAFVGIIKVVLESSLADMAEPGPLCMPAWMLAGRLITPVGLYQSGP